MAGFSSKQHEQAILLHEKAMKDLSLVEQVVHFPQLNLDDDIVGFHAQQAVEKLLKAVLSENGAHFRRTHDLRVLMEMLERIATPVPFGLTDLDLLTPFGVTSRYARRDACTALDRRTILDKIHQLRNWAEAVIQPP